MVRIWGYAMPDSETGALRKKALSIAKALNAITAADSDIKFTKETEDGRFRIQKTVYLLKRLGYPAAQKFDFNLYLMGPYSPDLTKCYYELGDEGIRSAGIASDLSHTKRDLVIHAIRKGDDFLEGLTALLDVYRQVNHLPAALANAKALKRHIGPGTWKEVREFLGANPGLIAPT